MIFFKHSIILSCFTYILSAKSLNLFVKMLKKGLGVAKKAKFYRENASAAGRGYTITLYL